jgi:hypothetical protein
LESASLPSARQLLAEPGGGRVMRHKVAISLRLLPGYAGAREEGGDCCPANGRATVD